MDDALARPTYLEAIEASLGLPLKPEYLHDIRLSLDDCVRIFDALTAFYAPMPFSAVPETPSAEFVPVFTADIANMIEPGSLLARIGERFGGVAHGPANRLANLMVYAPRVIVSDMLVSYGEMWRQDVDARCTDDEIVRFVEDELRAMARLTHLFRAGTIVTYSPYGGDRAVYDDIQDRAEMEVGVGLLDDPDLLAWVRSEVATEFAEEWMQTHVGMAIQEVAESILFTKAFGFNSGPVYSSEAARRGLGKVIDPHAGLAGDALAEQQRQYRIASNSLIDLAGVDPAALGDMRFDSRAFATWRTFVDESIARIVELRQADAGFDAALARDLERRSADFERMLVMEFGDTSLARCFRFDRSNVIGLVAGAALGLGGPLSGQLASLLVPTVLERAHGFVAGLHGERLKVAMRSHYHAFVPRRK